MAPVKPVKAAAKAPVKAPAAAKAAPAKVAAKAAPKAAPAKAPAEIKPPKFEGGSYATFHGYQEGESGMFTAGEKVYVALVQTDAETGKHTFIIVKEADAEACDGVTDFEAEGAPEAELATGRHLRKLPAEPEKVVVHHVGELDKLLKKHNDPVAVARDLYEDERKSAFYLGGVLMHIQHEKGADYLKEHGYEDTEEETAFEQFCKNEIGISQRTAKDYMAIYATYAGLPNFNVKKLIEIGWSKAAMLVNYVTPENVDKLMTEATEHSYPELRTVLQENYVSEDGTSPSGRRVARQGIKRVTMGPFRLHEDQAANVKLVWEMAGKQLGMADKPDALFEAIVMQWGEQNLTGPQLSKIKKAAPAKVAAKAGAKTTAKAA